MSINEAGLLLVAGGLLGLAAVAYSHSKNFTYLEGLHMAGKAAVLAAISGLMLAIANEKKELAEARAEEKVRQEALIAAARDGQDLTDVVAALNEATAQVESIIERPAPEVNIPELTEPEGDAQPANEVETINPISTDTSELGADEVVAEPVDETKSETGPTGDPDIDRTV